MSQPFILSTKEYIEEIKSDAFVYHHEKSGARLIHLSNTDENKVFGISFKTPREDSTGIAHILEHAVLCGSKQFPVKEPFVELLKASLKTFLNAFTYPDKTCYPVASTNEQDLINMMTVYLDAVLFPRITEEIFKQEGWHYELDDKEAPLRYSGVVLNEMKGSFSDPLTRLYSGVKESLFPDNAYRFISGGYPQDIVNLTYQDFKAFHETLYHPSNAYLFLYGDVDAEKCMGLLDSYLSQFEAQEVAVDVPIQPLQKLSFIQHVHRYDPGDEDDPRSMVAINWLFPEITNPVDVLELSILEYLLNGSSAAPLYKALIDSGLGDTVVGGGIHTELRQTYYSIGLKGIQESDADKVQHIVVSTLKKLVDDGLEAELIEAGMNAVEFSLRENNTGGYPRGLVCMLRVLGSWLYHGSPLALLAYEEPLRVLKEKLASGEPVFEGLINRYFLENEHSTSVLLQPQQGLSEEERKAEEQKLAQYKDSLSDDECQEIIDEAARLKVLQETPDDAEALARIPVLTIGDLDRSSKTIPTEKEENGTHTYLLHPLETSGIVYLDLAFPLRRVPGDLLPLIPLFSRALIEMGTADEDFVTLSRRIDRETGGLSAGPWVSSRKENDSAEAYFLVRGKVTIEKFSLLLRLMTDVTGGASFADRERFMQLVRQRKAGLESSIVPSGNRYAAMRLSAMYNEASWISEQMRGISQLHFVRQLEERLQSDWDSVQKDLLRLRDALFVSDDLLINITLDPEHWKSARSELAMLHDELSDTSVNLNTWKTDQTRVNEGFAIPSAVHYVGKTLCLYEHGYTYHGSILVINNILNSDWFWDKVRVQGGAYGGFGGFSRFTGLFTCLSYRDPNFANTLAIYDRTAEWLKTHAFTQEQINRAIIGSIGSIDSYQLPDARGHTAFVREVLGITAEERQKIRDEVFATSEKDFRDLGEVLSAMADHGTVCVLGPRESLEKEKARLQTLESLF